MHLFASIYDRAIARKGKAELEKLLPTPATAAQLIATPDDRYLAEMTKCIFRAGFVWRVIENKWPGFEEAFSGFNPLGMAHLSDEALERLGQDTRIVRNMQKIKTVRENAQFICDIAEEHGSFGQFLADWPSTDIVGLLTLLKKRGSRLGGNSAQYFLRFMGKDTFVLGNDVVACLKLEGVVTADKPSSQRDLKAIQVAFNTWAEETGLPLCQLSQIAACSID